MLALIAALTLGLDLGPAATPGAAPAAAPIANRDRTPAALHVAAYRDLRRLADSGQVSPLTTRYLSLHAVPAADRPGFLRALTFALNSVSWARAFGRVHPVEGWPELVRIDLADFGLDKFTRYARIMKLREIGVVFPTADAVRLLDPWEEIAAADPYFKVTQVYQGRTARGWLDPVVELAARQLSHSSNFLIAAHFALPRLLLERQDGGFYSDLLMLPAKEADLYRVLGADVAFAEKFNAARYGGAVLESSVAYHNRELQHLPAAIGDDESFVWRTFDFLNDDIADKNVLEALNGTARHDGRELIFSLNNGLHGYYLADAAGRQVNVVPQGIAEDRRPDSLSRQRSVINAYKCIDCHLPLQGIYTFDDEVVKALYDPTIGQVLATKDPAQGADFALAVRSYYLTDLQRRIERQQASYRQHVADAVGLLPEDEADPAGLTGRVGAAVVRHVERWTWDLVTPEQAAREMGVDVLTARQYWARAGVDPGVGKNQSLNNQFAFLMRGRPIRRAAWERIFPDIMRAFRYPWELQEVHK